MTALCNGTESMQSVCCVYVCVLVCFVCVFVCVHSLRGLGTRASEFYDCTAAGVVHSSYACMLVPVRT